VVLIQVLLPSSVQKGVSVADAFSQTRAELVAAFHGVTAYLRSPAQGAWTSSEGHVELDEVVMVEVVVEQFDRGWWQAYAKTLAARFAQDVIHIRAFNVEVLDDGAQ
jgi:hypothetical protein